MGDFGEASLMVKLTFKFTVMSFLMIVLAMTGGLVENHREVRALMIIAFLIILAVEILVFVLVYISDNFIIKILVCVGCFVSVLFIYAALGLSRRNCGGGGGWGGRCSLAAYATTLVVMSGISAIAAGVFMILELCGCCGGGGKTNPA